MKKHQKVFSLRTLSWAVQAALLTMSHIAVTQAAEAETDPEVLELTQHSNSIEIGAGYVGSGSYKAGEYNGLRSQGNYAIGNVDLRGGGAYDSEDSTRWHMEASDLGLDNRDFSIEYGEQGKFRLNLDYDEIRRNRSDDYQTPYLGAGTNSLTLPGNWIVPVVPRISGTTPNARGLSTEVSAAAAIVSGVPTLPTGAQQTTSSTLQAADNPAFHKVEMSTQRKRTDVGMSVVVDSQWQVKADFRHDDKTGLKPMGSSSRQTGSDISQIIPDLINQSTESVNIAAHYTGDHSFLQMGYYGSFFSNHVNGMTWQNWAKLTTPNLNTISSAPGNDFHQLNLTGGYDFSRTTRLVIDAALGKSTQNDTVGRDDTTPVVPISTANAVIDSKTFSLKLTGRATPDLQLAAVYKYDARENHTPVNTFQFSDSNQPIAPLNTFNGAVVAQNANANLPYSKKLNKLGLDADYRLGKGHSIKTGYEYQSTERWCEGTWISCVEAATTNDSILKLEYRNSMLDNLSGRVGYERGFRTISNYNENAFLALVPFANVSPTGAPGGATAYGTMLANGLNGWGPNLGTTPAPAAGSALAFFFANNNALSNALYGNENRISELPGLREYNMADRAQDKVKAAVNWQASEELGIQAGVKLHKDDYANSVYGLKEANGWALNLDANYMASDSLSFSAFYSLEDQHAKSAGNTYTANSAATAVNGFTTVSGGCYSTIATRNANNKIDPCNNWTADLHDQIDTLGLAFTAKDLMSGKLQVKGDVSITHAVTNTNFTGGNYVNNPLAVVGAPGGTVAAYYIAATSLPKVTTKTFDLHLMADYAMDKMRTVRLGYLYSYLYSQDWAYDGMQAGGLTQVLPTYEQSPTYSVHAIAVSYVHRFR